MTLHHSFNISDSKRQCFYCSTSFAGKEWQTVHEGTKLYKAMSCPSCARLTLFPVNFLGSGHDSWDGRHSWVSDKNIAVHKSEHKIKGLEKKIEILSKATWY